MRHIRDNDWAAGPADRFKRVRSGTQRAVLVRMAGSRGGAHIDAMASAINSDRRRVMAHLFCFKRDCAYGFAIKDGRVSLRFPDDLTWRDAIKAA